MRNAKLSFEAVGILVPVTNVRNLRRPVTWNKVDRYKQDKAQRESVPIVRDRAATPYCVVYIHFLVVATAVAE